jgi:hypothetical protein
MPETIKQPMPAATLKRKAGRPPLPPAPRDAGDCRKNDLMNWIDRMATQGRFASDSNREARSCAA